MVDDPNFHSDLEEYKLQEESSVGTGGGEDEEQQAVLPSQTASKISRAKRLFIPIILVVVIIVVYQLLSWYSNRKAQNSLKQEEVVAQKSVQNITAPPIPTTSPQAISAQPAGTIKPTPLDTETDDITVQQKLDILAQRAESNTVQMEKMKEAISQNQAGLVNLNHAINTLAGTVQDLHGSVQQLMASQKAKKVKKVKKEVSPKVLYHVKAIVPGLAWLESSRGQTVAVRVGQELPGYGRVRLISPKDGMVITSSGYVIQYGVNDF